MTSPPEVRLHPTAIVEEGVRIGRGSSVWDSVHIRRGATLGEECIVGEKSYIAYDVVIGSRVKINAMVYVCFGVTVGDGVMISAGTIFTNDTFPRAATPDLTGLRGSEPDEETLETIVGDGATIGAACTIGPGVRIGSFAMIGMGSVVTRDVPDFHLAIGSPARSVGCVCRCGQPVARWAASGDPTPGESACPKCGRRYTISATGAVEERS